MFQEVKHKKINKKIKIYLPNKIKSTTSLITIKYLNKELELIFLVNPQNHFLIEGSIRVFNKNDVLLNFGKVLIKDSLNKPIYEVRDHILIYLEKKLRPSKSIKYFEGIILPSNIGTIFSIYRKILVKMYDKYCKQTKVSFGMNEYEADINLSWKKKSLLNKKKTLQKYFNEFLLIKKSSLKPSIIDIKDEKLVHLNFDNSSDFNKLIPNFMLDLECYLNNKLKFNLELFYISKKDENKLRTKNIT